MTTRLRIIDALIKGDPLAVESIGPDIDWSEMAKWGGVPELLHKAGIYTGGPWRSRQEAVYALLSVAAQAGRTEAFATFERRDPSVNFPQPVLDFIRNDYARVLALYVENGFNPREKLGDFGECSISAIELARSIQSDNSAVAMQSALSRMTVAAALQSSGMPPSSSPDGYGSRSP